MIEQVEIAVIGSGAAGIAAAVSAARAGRTTLVIDRRDEAGGTGGFSGVTTLCGLYDGSGRFLNGDFSREFADGLAESEPLKMGRVWVLPYRPAKFREISSHLLASTPNIQTRWETSMENVVVKDSRIVTLNGVRVGAVIDCTGTAEVARAVGAECLETTETTQAPAVIFPLHSVDRALNTPAAVAQVLLPLARAGLPPLSFQPSLETNVVSVKFTGRPDDVPHVIEFLRTHVSGFENCATPLTEFAVARRDGRMVMGRYLLTGTDVLAGRKFPDGVARCAWPIEQWGADGVTRFKYLPEGTHYEVPGRSLCAARIDNLFMAGKTISADVEAIASVRVMGCCLATGAAAGKLAAAYVESVRQ
jgi:hypothetical protein